MSESTSYNGRFRPRAQSLFEYRPRTNTELTIALLDRLISSRDSTSPSNVTTGPSDTCDVIIRASTQRTIFFIIQPLIAGFIIFPLLILFWQAGWNFTIEWLKIFDSHWVVLVMLYILAQLILLFIYLNQDHLYDYLRTQKISLYVAFILQIHTLMTSLTYIIQWVSMWSIGDKFTSESWSFLLVISIAALLAVIALMGHPCDLICAPFILSYDSIEYNIRIGSPFLTEKISDCLAHFINFIFYEFIIALLSILAWRGTYNLFDVFLFPGNDGKSGFFSLLLGYPFYFLLMYTQSYTEKFCLLPSFIYINYPTFLNNIRHVTAFFTCISLWRGYWILFDTYIATMSLGIKSPYLFYLICMFISFLTLSLIKSASSINGPMSHMSDQYDLFPHYPNCYLIKWFDQNKKSDSNKNSNNEPYTISLL